jgi:hypothetical protein
LGLLFSLRSSSLGEGAIDFDFDSDFAGADFFFNEGKLPSLRFCSRASSFFLIAAARI